MNLRKNDGGKSSDEIEDFREEMEDLSFAELVDKLIQLRIEGSSIDDLTEKSKHNLKIRSIKREMNDRFLRQDPSSEDKENDRVSKISSIL
jgi:hypothetical protein